MLAGILSSKDQGDRKEKNLPAWEPGFAASLKIHPVLAPRCNQYRRDGDDSDHDDGDDIDHDDSDHDDSDHDDDDGDHDDLDDNDNDEGEDIDIIPWRWLLAITWNKMKLIMSDDHVIICHHVIWSYAIIWYDDVLSYDMIMCYPMIWYTLFARVVAKKNGDQDKDTDQH